MKFTFNTTKFIVALIFLIDLNVNYAQNFLLQSLPSESIQLGVRYQRPNLEGESSLSTFTGVYDLYTNFSVSEKFNLIADIPIIGFSTSDGYSQEGIGNILLGIQYHNLLTYQHKSVLTIGVYLPTINETKNQMQIFGVITNQYESSKYWGNVFAIYTNYAYYNKFIKDISFCVELGPEILFWDKSLNDSKTDFYAHFGVHLGLKINYVTLSSEYQGVINISGDYDNFSDRLQHGVLLGAQWNKDWFRPKGYYNFYLKDDMRKIANGVIGIAAEFWF